VDEPRGRELDLPASSEKLTATGREDVLQPGRVRSVGQRPDVAAAGKGEDIDGGLVSLCGLRR